MKSEDLLEDLAGKTQIPTFPSVVAKLKTALNED